MQKVMELHTLMPKLKATKGITSCVLAHGPHTQTAPADATETENSETVEEVAGVAADKPEAHPSLNNARLDNQHTAKPIVVDLTAESVSEEDQDVSDDEWPDVELHRVGNTPASRRSARDRRHDRSARAAADAAGTQRLALRRARPRPSRRRAVPTEKTNGARCHKQ